jgi:hypothetical protein
MKDQVNTGACCRYSIMVDSVRVGLDSCAPPMRPRQHETYED